MTETLDNLINKPEEIPRLQPHAMWRGGSTQWRQWLASISATLSMVAVGTVYGWITAWLGRLEANKDVPFRVTKDEASWIVSITVITSMFGSFLGACLADRCGRKLSLLSSSFFFITGWIFVIYAESIEFLYASRVILGIGVGIAYTTNPMYVSEVADTNIRGALGTLIAVNVFTGSLLTCCLRLFVSYNTLAIILLLIAVVFVGTFLLFPESPYYLAIKGKSGDAIKAIKFFKGCTDVEAKEELEIIIRNINDDRNGDVDWREKCRGLLSHNNRKAFIIVLGLIVTQQFSGNFTTIQYLSIFFKAAHIGIDEDHAVIIVLAVGLISGTVATMTVECAGRRPLLIISALSCSVTLTVLSAYLLLVSMSIDLTVVNLLPVALVIMFQISYQIGIGTLPNALIGELFPTSAKSIAGAALTISDGILGFIVTKLYSISNTELGEHYVYFFFAGSCFYAFILILLFVPETKNKTFLEIQDELAMGGVKFKFNKCFSGKRELRTSSRRENDRVV